MFELTDERRKTFKAFLLNAGTVFLAGLVLGAFVRPEGFNLLFFISGCILYASTIAASVILDAKADKER